MTGSPRRTLVAGASGVLGGELARALHRRGDRLALAGRNTVALESLAGELADAPVLSLDAYDLDGCAALAGLAADRLGGLDGVAVAIGAVSFETAVRATDPVVEHLFAVNALAPMAILRGALPLLTAGGTLAAFTGIVVDRPQPGMAAYCASKAALSAWLDAVRREVRRDRVSVLDVRAPHMDTGLVDRAVSGTAPVMPPGADIGAVVDRMLEGMDTGAARLSADPRTGELSLD